VVTNGGNITGLLRFFESSTQLASDCAMISLYSKKAALALVISPGISIYSLTAILFNFYVDCVVYGWGVASFGTVGLVFGSGVLVGGSKS
jgi:hypothetical protein